MSLEKQDILATASEAIWYSSSASLRGLSTPGVGDYNARKSGGLTIIKPVPKAVEPILYKIFRRSKVEPGINCLESALLYQNAMWIFCQVSRLLGEEGRRTFVNNTFKSYTALISATTLWR